MTMLIFIIDMRLVGPRSFVVCKVYTNVDLIYTLLSVGFRGFVLVTSSSIFKTVTTNDDVFCLRPCGGKVVRITLYITVNTLDV